MITRTIALVLWITLALALLASDPPTLPPAVPVDMPTMPTDMAVC